MIRLLLAIVVASCLSVSFAYDRLDIELESGTQFSLTQFQSEGKTLLLWLPSEYGFAQGYVPVALDLEARGFDVWVAHLHDTYMLPAGRRSLNGVDIADILLLIELAHQQGYENLFFISSNRGVQLALKLSYLWQEKHIGSDFIRGHLFFSPHIFKGRTELGRTAEFVDLSAYSNLPIYMLQAQYSTKYAHSWSIARQLQRGGSPVFVHFVKGVQGGFQSRPETDLTEDDIDRRGELGGILEQATFLLSSVGRSGLTAGHEVILEEETSDSPHDHNHTLQPYKGDKASPVLSLNDLSGNPYNLSDSAGRVVLVNFWASWCGPCVKEIPSLSRLVDAMRDKPFDVIAINIGEPADVIRKFLKQVPVNFDILLDTDGSTVRDWRVYAYPSSFLIDHQGRVLYAYRGALEWDEPGVVSVIENLFR